MYPAFYASVLFASLAMMVREGLWSNTLMLVNIIISGLVAFGFYSPLVIFLDELSGGQHTYWLDYAVIWGLFMATMAICRSLSAAASKTRMRFKYPIDPVGGPLVGLLASWVLTSFVLATLHTAPLPKDIFGDWLNHPVVASASAITTPDAAWLQFVEKMSQVSALGSLNTEKFSANAFVSIYADHRDKFDKAPKLINKRG
jgi:hypothetical protein